MSADSNVAVVGITVTPVNDEPTFVIGPRTPDTVLEDSGLRTVIGWATQIKARPGNETDGSCVPLIQAICNQTLTFNVTNDNNALFAVPPAIDPVTGTLTYTPALNANGDATVTVTLIDDGGTANSGDDTSDSQAFTITVAAVNDAPSFTSGGESDRRSKMPERRRRAWATVVSAGPPNEAGQTLTFSVSNNNDALFSTQPAIAPNGTLTYTPASDANGSAT